jgi:hypothetical protein
MVASQTFAQLSPPRLSFPTSSLLGPAGKRVARGRLSRRPGAGARRLPPAAAIASSSWRQPLPEASLCQGHAAWSRVFRKQPRGAPAKPCRRSRTAPHPITNGLLWLAPRLHAYLRQRPACVAPCALHLPRKRGGRNVTHVRVFGHVG